MPSPHRILTRTECYLTLNRVRSIGPIRARKLIEAFGSVNAIFEQSAHTLATIGKIPQAAAQNIVDWQKNWSLEEELKRAEDLHVQIIDCEDSRFPKQLLQIYDPPLVLYCKGNLEALCRSGIAVVGSRHTTTYGFEIARKLSYQAAYAGLVITSGLARGIDTAAHQGALAANGLTIAVLGSSIDLVYPEENQPLADKIVEKGGAVISEFSFGTPPTKYTFPLRNRIVSGLSEGVLVIEAGEKSGALITARLAGEHGRQVFAVPGRIDTPHSKGCHQLLKDGAHLVETIEDVFTEFELLFPKVNVQSLPQKLPENLTQQEKAILDALADQEEVHLDSIIEKSGLQPSEVSSTLLRLQLAKLVRQLPGNYFVRTV